MSSRSQADKPSATSRFASAMKSAWSRLVGEDGWWFGKGSPVTLGAFRIAIGFLAFVNLAMVAIDFDAWYTERGFVPIELEKLFLGDVPRFNPLINITDPRLMAFFYGLIMLAALLTSIGLFTRISSIFLALGLIALNHRNSMIVHGGDTLLRMCCIYVAVGPSGAACSLDRLIALWKRKALPLPPQVSLWAQRLIQYQVALMYFTTVWHKWFGSHWRDGTATWYPARLTEFDRFPIPAFLERPPMTIITTYGTLIVELALATLVFSKPLRKWVLLAGLAMHGYIEFRYNIPLFAWIVAATYMTFYEGDEVSRWFKRLGSRLKSLHIKVMLPTDKQLAVGPGDTLRALDALSLIEYQPNGPTTHWKIADDPRPAATAESAILKRCPAAWPLALIPGVWKRVLSASLAPFGSVVPNGSSSSKKGGARSSPKSSK